LLRARHTAEIIATCLHTGVTTDPDLREKSFGEAEGKPQAWLRERRIPLPDKGERLRHDEGIPGAETRMDLAERCYRAMARILESPESNQIVVTHGGPATVLIVACIEMPLEAAGRVQFAVSSGSITVLRKDPWNFSHQLVELNDVSHLVRG
jgi:probable phosphoglycerate mutase